MPLICWWFLGIKHRLLIFFLYFYLFLFIFIVETFVDVPHFPIDPLYPVPGPALSPPQAFITPFFCILRAENDVQHSAIAEPNEGVRQALKRILKSVGLFLFSKMRNSSFHLMCNCPNPPNNTQPGH